MMADYKKMYMTLLQATEGSIQSLIAAQEAAEEIYITTGESELILLEPDKKE